jgi:hypothetical protein
MTDGGRLIDRAMSSDRPAKDSIRTWWVEEAKSRLPVARRLKVPVYFTLPGAAGRDIQALINEGLIRVNESGGILDEDAGLIVALENNMLAYGELKKRFPGLAVRHTSVEALLGNQPDQYPTGLDKKLCRATIINLDFNSALQVATDGSVKAIVLAEKFARIHEGSKDRPVVPWALCLTLNASFTGADVNVESQHSFLLDQVADSDELRVALQEIAPWLLEHDYDLATEADTEKLQRALACLVPTLIARTVSQHGWRVAAKYLARYGHDAQDTASMVTFVLDMTWDEAARAQPNAAAKQTHGTLAQAMRAVGKDGTVDAGP